MQSGRINFTAQTYALCVPRERHWLHLPPPFSLTFPYRTYIWLHLTTLKRIENWTVLWPHFRAVGSTLELWLMICVHREGGAVYICSDSKNSTLSNAAQPINKIVLMHCNYSPFDWSFQFFSFFIHLHLSWDKARFTLLRDNSFFVIGHTSKDLFKVWSNLQSIKKLMSCHRLLDFGPVGSKFHSGTMPCP